MSFGRWLLVNSFSIFILCLFFFGYIYRSELLLESAYQQLFEIAPKATILADSLSNTTPPVHAQTDTTDKNKVANTAVVDQNETVSQNHKQPNVLKTVSTMTEKPVENTNLTTISAETQSDKLNLARQAYWDKNYADAIYLYRQLIHESNNPNYLGELGNIYYFLNDHQNASQLYYQTAMIFIHRNQLDKARPLVAPIMAMNRELGERLSYILK